MFWDIIESVKFKVYMYCTRIQMKLFIYLFSMKIIRTLNIVHYIVKILNII